MAKRKTSMREYKTPALQGAGSYVIFKALTVGEIKEIRETRTEVDDGDAFEVGLDTIAKHLIGWNWVDDDGDALPLPSEDPEVINLLTDDECTFLAEKLIGKADSKN